MKRRQFLSSIALAFPVAISGPAIIFSSCARGGKAAYFSDDDIQLLDEIGETIIPSSASSPGAKAAKVGEFMRLYVSDCYTQADQEVFSDGIASFKTLCKKKYRKEFSELPLSRKRDFLRMLEEEVRQHDKPGSERKASEVKAGAIQTGKAGVDEKGKAKAKGNAGHYFTMIKNLTLLGYFTSEPGATKSLRYIQTPGHFSGDIPYRSGDRAWAV